MATLASLVFVACAGGPAPTFTPTPTLTPTSAPTPTLPPGVGHVNVQVISSELSVGANRLVFALLDNDLRPVLGATVEVSTFYPVGASPGVLQQVVDAPFRKWPLGEIGVYTVQLGFHESGTWGLRVEAAKADGSAIVGAVEISVAEGEFYSGHRISCAA